MYRLLLLVLLSLPAAAQAQPAAVPLPDSLAPALPVASDSVSRPAVPTADTSGLAGPPGVGADTSHGAAPPERARYGLYQPESERLFSRRRLYGGLGLMGSLDVAGALALSQLWYGGERVPFHWYSEAEDVNHDGWLDDWHTYVQMDKGGHVVTSYHIARMVGEYGRWSGLSDASAALLGVGASTIFQTQIELLDGFDPVYGASRTDLLANALGAGLGGLKIAYPEQTAWFDVKISYAPSAFYDEDLSPLPPVRLAGNFVKDYEGLTYWLSLSPSALGAPDWWPAWLNVAAGYGGKNLAHAISGRFADGGRGAPEHVRQYYLSLDIDVLRHVRAKVPSWLRPVTMFFEMVRLPAPALELSSDGITLHALHF